MIFFGSRRVADSVDRHPHCQHGAGTCVRISHLNVFRASGVCVCCVGSGCVIALPSFGRQVGGLNARFCFLCVLDVCNVFALSLYSSVCLSLFSCRGGNDSGMQTRNLLLDCELGRMFGRFDGVGWLTRGEGKRPAPWK